MNNLEKSVSYLEITIQCVAWLLCQMVVGLGA
jgi:hypothetical protein